MSAHRLTLALIVLTAAAARTTIQAETTLADMTIQAPFLPKYSWKTDIVGTVFWVGEQPGQNNPVPNTRSSWDVNWMARFGGVDDPNPTRRTEGFHPAGFVPMQNPFYVALPYNDIRSSSNTKDEAAKIIPWFKESFQKEGRSVCHNRWIAIHHRGRVCFAQWSDCGPFTTSDSSYVFGESRPTNTKNGGAGIDLSPAVRDFLGFRSGDTCDWRFVDEHEIAEGPWKHYGTNNPFASAHKTERKPEAGTKGDGKITATFSVSAYRPVAGVKTKRKARTDDAPQPTKTTRASAKPSGSRLDELKRMRDEWFDAR